MTENELKEYQYIVKEIQILSKELINVKSDYLVRKQNFMEKLYVGEIIQKTSEELEAEIHTIEEKISNKLKELIKRRIDIEEYIDTVSDCEIRLLLRLRFINCMSFNEMASELTVTDESGNVLRTITGDGLSMKLSRFFKGRR